MSLTESWHEPDFKEMQEDGNTTYHIEFEDGTERTTTITAIAYLARLDPEATIVDSE